MKIRKTLTKTKNPALGTPKSWIFKVELEGKENLKCRRCKEGLRAGDWAWATEKEIYCTKEECLESGLKGNKEIMLSMGRILMVKQDED